MTSTKAVFALGFVTAYTVGCWIALNYDFSKYPHLRALFQTLPSTILAPIYGTLFGVAIAIDGPTWLFWVSLAGLLVTSLIVVRNEVAGTSDG